MVEEKVIIKVSADTSDFKKGMKDASESARDVKKSTDKTGAVAGDSISRASVNLNKSGDKLQGKFKGLGAKFSGLGEQITASLGKAVPGFNKITEKLKGAGKVGKAGFVAIGVAAVAAIAAIAAKLTKMAVDISGKFVKAFNPARFDAQMGKMKKSAEKLKTTLGAFLEPLFTALTNGLSWIMDKLTAFLEGILSVVGFIGGLLGIMDGVARSMDDMADSMEEASMAADQGLASFDKLTTLGEIYGDAEQAERLNAIMADSARKAQELKRGLKDTLKDIPGRIASTFIGIVASAASSILNLGGKIKDLFNGPIMDGLDSAKTAVVSWASSAGETLNGLWNTVGDGARSLWANISTRATGALSEIKNTIVNTFSELPGKIRKSFEELWAGFRSSAEEALSGLADWVKDIFKKAIDAILAPVYWAIDQLKKLKFWDKSTTNSSSDNSSGDDNRTEREVKTPIEVKTPLSPLDPLKKGLDTLKNGLDSLKTSISDVIPSGGDNRTEIEVKNPASTLDKLKKGLGRLKFWADGGVAEPNNPFLAVVGDNRTEREVMTPVSLLRATMREVLMEMGTESGNRQINLDVNLDGRRIARATYDYMEMERRRRGV